MVCSVVSGSPTDAIERRFFVNKDRLYERATLLRPGGSVWLGTGAGDFGSRCGLAQQDPRMDGSALGAHPTPCAHGCPLLSLFFEKDIAVDGDLQVLRRRFRRRPSWGSFALWVGLTVWHHYLVGLLVGWFCILYSCERELCQKRRPIRFRPVSFRFHPTPFAFAWAFGSCHD